MSPHDLNEVEIGPGLKLTFALLIALILGGNGLLLWQFHLARLQTERLTNVNQELIGVLRLQVSLLSVHQRLDSLAQSRDAGGLASESVPLRRTLLEEIQAEMSTLTRLPYETHVEPEFQPTLQAIEITLPTQLEAINGLAALGDWKALRLRLDNELEPVESLCASLVAGTDQEVTGELALAVANTRRTQLTILLLVPTTAISTFFVAAFLAWTVTRRMITLRMHARVEALRESERNLRQVVDSIPGFVCALSPQGEVELVNRQLLEYFGKTFEEMKDWATNDAIHPDDRARSVAMFGNSVKTGTPHEVEQRCRRADGVYRWFQRSARPVLDASGRISAWYVLITDIEDRKRAEEEHRLAEEALNELRSELAHMARVTSLGALTASIAHEVNQPLSGIVTNAGICLRTLSAEPPNIDTAREAARRMIRDGNRASDVIARLRALFSNKKTAFESVDLNEAAREVIALCSDDLQRSRVILRHELANDLPRIEGDRVQLQQVILNLLRNGADAMSEVEDRPKELVVRTETDEGNWVRLTVQDSGVGIDPENLDKLFEAFYTTKTTGMGIGLSVSRSIIESHHGRLCAAPNHGPGAAFSFSIPRHSLIVE